MVATRKARIMVNDADLHPLSVISLVNGINAFSDNVSNLAWMEQRDGTSFTVYVNLDKTDGILEKKSGDVGHALAQYLNVAATNIAQTHSGERPNIVQMMRPPVGGR